MKYSFLVKILIIVLILLFSCKTKKTQKEDEEEKKIKKIHKNQLVITIGADRWMPFNGDPGSNTPGYMVELLQEIFESEGFIIDYQVIPWNRSLLLGKEGEIDGVIGATPQEAPGFVFPGEPIYHIPPDIFYVLEKTEWRFAGIDSLKSIRVGFIGGYDYGDPVLNAYLVNNEGTEFVQVMYGENPLEKNIKKLLSGRIDTLIASPPVIKWKMKEMKLAPGRIISAGNVGGDSNPYIYVAFSPAKESSKKYAEIFDKRIKELRASGRFKEIIDKYGLDDF